MKHANTTARQLTRGIVTIVLLLACLCVTSLALILASVRVNENWFETGSVQLNLNDGKSVINAINFEPGATLKRDFFLENQSSDPVYYKLYFAEIKGGLASVVEVKITPKIDGETGWEDIPADQVLYSGPVSGLTRAKVSAAGDDLEVGEVKNFSIFFHFPEQAGNSAQDLNLEFTLCAEATQTRNNPGMAFD